MQMQMQGSESVNNNNLDNSSNSGDENEITPKITDGFTITALILAVIVLILSLPKKQTRIEGDCKSIEEK
jgi:hypothetical protein